jgi:hypothetical protein
LRLTEKGQTSKASLDGLFEPPPNDFLKWDGTLFDPKPYRLAHNGGAAWHADKLKNPSTDVGTTPVPTSGTPPVPTSGTPQNESGTDVGSIEGENTGTDVGTISRLTTTVVEAGPAPGSPSAPSDPPIPPSDSPLEEETKIGLSEAANNVIHIDPRIAALEAAEKRRKLR